MSTFWSRHCFPRASPTSLARSSFQVAASETAGGNAVAGKELFIPTLLSSSFSLRRPWGPSDMTKLPIPSLEIGFVVQKSLPEHKDAFSSRVIRDMSSLILFLSIKKPIFTCFCIIIIIISFFNARCNRYLVYLLTIFLSKTRRLYKITRLSHLVTITF